MFSLYFVESLGYNEFILFLSKRFLDSKSNPLDHWICDYDKHAEI